MKKELSLIFIFLLISSSAWGITSEKKFDRAMLLTGGGMDIASFIGMYDAYTKKGMEPDLLIGSCGGSIAVAIIKAIPSKEARLTFLNSEAFHDYLKTVKMNGLVPTVKHIITNWYRAVKKEQEMYYYSTGSNLHRFSLVQSSFDKTPPEIYKDPRVRKNNLLDMVLKEDERPAVIFMAGLMLNGEDAHKDRVAGDKLFQEAYFTDEATAELLRGRESRIGRTFPNSYVANETVVVTGKTLWESVRASISDPNLVAPAKIDGENYFSGAINLNPFEMASELANEVVAKYPNPFSFVESDALQDALGYDAKANRKKFVSTDKVDRWIDMTNDGVSSMLGPKIGVSYFLSMPMLMPKTKVPGSIKEFRSKVKEIYDAGYDKAIESINEAEGTKRHIDKPFHDGSNN